MEIYRLLYRIERIYLLLSASNGEVSDEIFETKAQNISISYFIEEDRPGKVKYERVNKGLK